MKKIAIIFTLLLFSILCIGQNIDTIPKVRNISFELLGNGALYSIKYENALSKNNKLRYSFGGNVMFPFKPIVYNLYGFSLGPECLYLIGKSHHKFELGLGINGAYFIAAQRSIEPEKSLIIFWCSGRIGYRFEGEKNIFKIGLTPIIGLYSNHGSFISGVFPWVGIGYGRKF